MNFLKLCQRLRVECGLSGTGPSSVVGQTGEMLRLVQWINDAWMDIQSAHEDWRWLRTSMDFVTEAGRPTYHPASYIGLTDFGAWVKDSFRVYDTAVGMNSEAFVGYATYDAWRNAYQFGASRSITDRPKVVAIAPDNSLAFGPVTAAGYTIIGDYYKAPREMAIDTDTPEMPAHFHMAIVYRAMMAYAGYDAASEVYQRGELEFTKLMRRMTPGGLPEISMGGPLS